MACAKARRDISAGYLCKITRRRALRTENGLHASTTLPTDRCHLDGLPVGINGEHRDHTAVGKEYMIEWAIGLNQGLPPLATDVLKFRHEPFEVASRHGQSERPVISTKRTRLGWVAGKAPPAGHLSTMICLHIDHSDLVLFCPAL